MEGYSIETHQVEKRYGKQKALRNVSLAIKQKGIYGLVGENGSGKTTLFRILSGMAHPSKGYITLNGKREAKEMEQIRSHFGCVIENPFLHQHLSVKDNMELHRILCGVPNKDYVHELIQNLHLDTCKRKPAKKLSSGMKQRLGIAMAFLNKPKCLLLDEPFNFLDPVGKKLVKDWIANYYQNRDCQILISSHNLAELYEIATHFIFIHNGTVLKTLSKNEIHSQLRKHILIESANIEKVIVFLEEKMHARNYKVISKNKLYLFDFIFQFEKLQQEIAAYSLQVETCRIVEEENLESFYLRLLEGSHV